MNKIIILLGPTCAGKTEVSISLAKILGTEIISADSMQIYRFMDIGTAKPDRNQLSDIKHHMIDIVNPWETFSAGKYIKTIVPIIENLHVENKIPIIVGGTGLYIKAMTRGIFKGPSADWSVRESLLEMEKNHGGILYDYLRKLDPEAASKITSNDIRRIIRAIEVFIKSNIKISEIQKNMTHPLPYEFIKIGLTRDRKELYQLIEKRVDKMIVSGLVEEVKKIVSLIDNYLYSSSTTDDKPQPPFPSLQALGYKEIIMYLQEKISLSEAIRLIKRNTKRYAKRQFTWFKKEEGISWIDITGINDINMISNLVFEVIKNKIES